VREGRLREILEEDRVAYDNEKGMKEESGGKID